MMHGPESVQGGERTSPVVGSNDSAKKADRMLSSPRLLDLPLRQVVALLTALAAVGVLSIVLPAFIHTLMAPVGQGGLGLSATAAGGLGTTEMLAGATTAFVLSSLSLSPRLIVPAGAVVAILANLACLATDSPEHLFVLRALAGIGLGASGAGAAKLLSALADPEKAAALAISLGTAIGSVALLLLPGLIQQFSTQGLFLVFAIISVCVLLAAPYLPTSLIMSVVATTLIEDQASISPELPKAGPNSTSLLGVGALLLLIIGDASLYAFSVPYGERVGLSVAETSRLLAGYTIIGVFAAATAGFLAERAGRRRLILVLCAAKSMAAIGVALGSLSSLFIVAQGVLALTIFAAQPLFLGVIAVLDRSGRSSAIAAGCQSLGAASGPILGGALFDHTPHWVLPIFAAAITGAALLLAMIASQRAASPLQRPSTC